MTLTSPTLRPEQSAVRSITIPEYGTATIACNPDVAASMDADGHFAVSPTREHGHYEIKAKHKVGVLRYGDLEIRIVPKVAVGRLLYLASYHSDPNAWRQLETLLDETDDPLSAIAHALVLHGERALSPAPLQGYVTHEEPERRIRGRVLFDKQLSRRAGLVLPVELRYDEYELGIAENRVLKAALVIVERFVGDTDLLRRIRHLRSQLDGVEPWQAGAALPDFVFDRLNLRYQPALALARLVLERRSLEYPHERSKGSAFLFNMNRVFEAYLEAALGKELGRIGGRVVTQHPTHLDVSGEVLMKPDITWWYRDRCLAVFDAKYKRTTNVDYPNADAYQMLAYCTRLGLDHGFLVYADLGGDQERTTVVRHAGTKIVVTSLDLGGSIENLEQTVQSLAADAVSTVSENVYAT